MNVNVYDLQYWYVIEYSANININAVIIPPQTMKFTYSYTFYLLRVETSKVPLVPGGNCTILQTMRVFRR